MDIRKLQKSSSPPLRRSGKGHRGDQHHQTHRTVRSHRDRQRRLQPTDRSLANNVQERSKAAGGEVLSVEGDETGEWVLVDLG